MFDQTFVDGAGRTNKGWAVTLSFAAEFAAVGILILVPLIWTEVLPKALSANSLTAPAPPPAPIPPAPAPPAAAPRQARIVPRAFNRSVAETPREIPRVATINAINEDIALPPASLAGDVSIAGAAMQGTPATFSNRIGPVSPPLPSAPPKPDVKPKQEAPVPVGGNVQIAKLIKHPPPTYPALAKSARIQGTVILQAIVGKDGSVRNLKVVSAASPLLVSSAIDAVKQWTYRPTLLNEMPVEVITEITVIFSLQ